MESLRQKPWTCMTCYKSFPKRFALIHHCQKSGHPTLAKWHPLICQEKFCYAAIGTMKNFIKHLKSVHGLKFIEEYIEFSSEAQFFKWKTEFEKECNCKFVKRKVVRSRHFFMHYFYCERSGEDSENILKKYGYYCTAHIVAKESIKTKSIEVSYCMTHYRHCGEWDVTHTVVNDETPVDSSSRIEDFPQSVLGLDVEKDSHPKPTSADVGNLKNAIMKKMYQVMLKVSSQNEMVCLLEVNTAVNNLVHEVSSICSSR